MIAFEISHNGQVLFTAGLADQRVLSFILSYRAQADDSPLQASARAVPPGDPFDVHATSQWKLPAVRVGDTLQIRIVDLPPEALTPGQAVEVDMSKAPAHVKAALEAMKQVYEQPKPEDSDSA